MGDKPSFIKAAFLVPANLLAVATAAVASAIVGDPIPLMVAAGMESVYLGLVSTSPQFRRAVRANQSLDDSDSDEHRDRMVNELSVSQREHYLQLRELRDKILANY